MADLNKMKDSAHKQSEELKKILGNLLGLYENLYREGNREYLQARAESDSMEGLEDFYRLVHTIKRNRDVVGTLMRGMRNLRPIDNFRFVEENVPESQEEEEFDTAELENILNVPEGPANG